MSRTARCKHCHSPIPPDGKPLPILRPVWIRALIEALANQDRIWDVQWAHDLRTLGLAEEQPKHTAAKIRGMRAAQARMIHAAYDALEEQEEQDPLNKKCRDFEGDIQRAIKDASRIAYEIERKEWRLTPFGRAVADWYQARWKDGPE